MTGDVRHQRRQVDVSELDDHPSYSATMTQSAWQLRGRNALVTGGTRGIGRAIVAELIELGATVTLVARSAAEVDAAVQELGGGVTGVAGDVTSAADRARIVAHVRERGPLHVLVHNAGSNVRQRLREDDHPTHQRPHAPKPPPPGPPAPGPPP